MIAGKRKTIGVFLCKTYAVFDNAVFSALEREAARLNYDVIVFTTVGYFGSRNDYDVQERKMFSFAPIEHLDGIIVAPDTYELAGFRETLYDELKRRAACPVVLIRHKDDAYDCVYTDEDKAMKPLLCHLLDDHGLKKVCFLAGYKGHPDSEIRLQVYLNEMKARGLAVNEETDIAYGNMWLESGKTGYEKWFSGPGDYPEAVVCANDYMAVGLIRLLTEHGIRVPQDVIVTGVDNAPAMDLDIPTLTTLEQDFGGMTVEAMNELDRQIREKSGPDGRKSLKRIPIEGRLILGESCGCGKKGKRYYYQISKEQNIELDQTTNREISMTYLTIELNACEDLQDLHRVLVEKMPDTPMVRDLYLCLFEKGKDEKGNPVFSEEITGTSCLVHLMRDRKDQGMPMIAFDTNRLLPDLAERSDEAQVMFLMLLHQRNNAFGYSLFHFQPGETPTGFFQHWNVILSGALSNMHKRNEMMLLYEERRLSSITDALTRLLNRRGLDEQLAPVWRQLCEARESVAFVSFDMDWLKQINDTYGHQAGDFAICLTADAIRRAAPGEAILSRLGGDEFMAVLPGAGKQAAEKFLKDFQKALEELNREADRAFTVEVSCGMEIFRLDSMSTFEECVRKSDETMYRVKELHHKGRS